MLHQGKMAGFLYCLSLDTKQTLVFFALKLCQSVAFSYFKRYVVSWVGRFAVFFPLHSLYANFIA